MDSTTAETEDIVFMVSKHRLTKNFFIEDVYYQLDDYNNIRIEIHYEIQQDKEEQRDIIITELFDHLESEFFLDSIYFMESSIYISRVDVFNGNKENDGKIWLDITATSRKYSTKLGDLNLLDTNEYNIYKASKRNKFIDNIINE